MYLDLIRQFYRAIPLSRLLNGLNKSIYIINQFKPIYSDLKPLILKGSTFLNSLNNYNSILNPINNNPKNTANYINDTDKNIYPQFFL